ncbi:MAG: hypothetical protein WA082_04405 [Candidatus Moraniibacteriota bacterium]
MSQIHKCGKCDLEFSSEESYVAHECEATGVTPADPEHQGPEFVAIQEAALARGEERKAAEEAVV